jgi:SAM-dependent methyltransferase
MSQNREKAALRGEPSYVWRAGQERRLQMIREAAGTRVHGRVLDNGCGVGAYLSRLAQDTTSAYGLEFDMERALKAVQDFKTIVLGAGEHLPYPSDTFDLVLSHEVLEHVQDDRAALEEIVRILRKPGTGSGETGGRLILFVPNRGYPFETHGIYWRGRYHFGNVPLINYLPQGLRNRFVPHVRAYTRKDLQRLLDGLPVHVLTRTTIFGAYDNIIARWPTFGRALRAILQFLERTPLQAFGLSHLWVIEKT